jgi:hypothetical protein
MLMTASAASAAPSGLTSVDVRDQFTRCGYEIANPQPAKNQYVVVEDPGAALARGATYRIIMAIVYPDTAAASAAHRKAHRQAEDRLGAHHVFSDDHGPQLLAGYGDSVWRVNVAMVESNSATLASMWSYDIQTDEARIARPELLDLGFDSSSTEYGVDRDFVVCLENAPLADNPLPTGVAPVYMPGQPW